MIDTLIYRNQREQLLLIEGGKAGALDAAEVAPRAFDPEHLDGFTRQGIDVFHFGTGVAASEVGDAEIGAEEVGAVTEEFGLVECGSEGRIPAIFKEFESGGRRSGSGHGHIDHFTRIERCVAKIPQRESIEK